MQHHLVWPRGVVAIACAAIGSGCPGEATQLLVHVTSDLRVPGELERIAVTISRADGTAFAGSPRSYPLSGPDAFALPLSFGVQPPAGAEDEPLSIDVRGLSPWGATLVDARVELDGFVAGEKRTLTITLGRACIARTCPAAETCRADGICGPAHLDRASLCAASEPCTPEAPRPSCPMSAPPRLPFATAAGAASPGGGSLLYLFTGTEGGGTPGRRTIAFDVHAGTWTEKAPRSARGTRFAAARWLDGRIFLFGLGPRADQVEVYTPRSDSWERVPHPLPHPRSGFGAAVGSDHNIYLIGGASPDGSAAVREVDVFSPMEGDFLPDGAAPVLPSPRIDAGVAIGPGGRIFVLGGATLEGVALQTTRALDVERRIWDAGPPLASARAGLAAAFDGDHLYALGGRLALTALDDLESLAAGADAWEAPAPMPTPRHALAAGIGVDGSVYAFGGLATGDQPLDVVEAYCPHEDRWR